MIYDACCTQNLESRTTCPLRTRSRSSVLLTACADSAFPATRADQSLLGFQLPIVKLQVTGPGILAHRRAGRSEDCLPPALGVLRGNRNALGGVEEPGDLAARVFGDAETKGLVSGEAGEKIYTAVPCAVLVLGAWENGQNGLEKRMSVEIISIRGLGRGDADQQPGGCEAGRKGKSRG